ncbi:MAG: 3-phosphoshikimate 1-carboxyvinyltransferase [Acutalibacteraceae bacterium]
MTDKDICKCSGGMLRGTVNIPPSKSAAHRAMLCAALADGRSTLSPIELSNDMRATINAITALGAHVEFSDGTLTIDGIGDISKNHADNEPVDINCIESGSTLRFIIPIAAAAGINGRFIGEGTLLPRPIGIYTELLPKAGVECITEGGLPLICRGRLQPGEYEIRGDISSQFITGMLFALSLCEGDSRLILTTPLQSSAYVDMTVCCMADFGVKVEHTDYGWFIPGGQKYTPRDYTVEGDWSHAGFFLAAGALGSELTLHGLRMDSVQGDMAALEMFRGFGAEITEQNGDLTVRKGTLHGQHINAQQIPDLVPCLAVCAALCEGTTIIDHAERLRIKESDRLASTASMINALGGKVTELPDGLKIEGVSQFIGGTVDGCRDHRIIMSAAIAALSASGEVTITTPHSVNKSYPSFFDVYNSLGGKANVINMGK